MASKRIGFVGLGTMGLPMAVNLGKAGFDVVGYDAFEGSRDKARAAGISVAGSLREVGERSEDAVVSMVRDYQQNVEVILGEDAILSAPPSGLTVIVMSTLDPDSMNELARRVEESAGVKLISAAVSGGAVGAEAGTLSIMTSGPQDRVEAARPYFEAMGSHVFYYGPEPGNSQAAKLVNNLVLGITAQAVAERPARDLRRTARPAGGDHHLRANGPRRGVPEPHRGDDRVQRAPLRLRLVPRPR